MSFVTMLIQMSTFIMTTTPLIGDNNNNGDNKLERVIILARITILKIIIIIVENIIIMLENITLVLENIT